MSLRSWMRKWLGVEDEWKQWLECAVKHGDRIRAIEDEFQCHFLGEIIMKNGRVRELEERVHRLSMRIDDQARSLIALEKPAPKRPRRKAKR